MGNVQGKSSKKSKEICEKLDLNISANSSSSSSRGNGGSSREMSASNKQRSRSRKNLQLNNLDAMNLDLMDEKMIDQVYAVIMAAQKEGNVDAQFLRKYVKQQLKCSKKGKAVLDEMSEAFDDDDLPVRSIVVRGEDKSPIRAAKSA